MAQQHRSSKGLDRVRAWEDHTAWVLFAGSIIFLAVLTWIRVAEIGPGRALTLGVGMITGLWIWFLIDYLIRLILARGSRKEFIRTRLPDLAGVVLPILRPYLILVYIWRLPVFIHGGARLQRRRYVLVTVMFAFTFVYTASYVVWEAERHDPKANIVNFSDALWWGFTTISTVGYGDFAPITGTGRLLAVGLMVGGIVIIGVVTATLISALNEHIRSVVLPGSPDAETDDDDEI